MNADSLRNHSGSLGADTIDLTLGGLLDNSGGLVEAAQTLSLDLNDARNANGKLRALGSSGESVFRLGGRFDNDNGLVEIGNAAFRLSSTQLSNQAAPCATSATRASASTWPTPARPAAASSPTAPSAST